MSENNDNQEVEKTFKYKVINQVTREIKKIDSGEEVFIIFEGEIYTGEVLEKAKIQTPPQLCNIIDLETGEKMLLILPKVLDASIQENYPNHSYVGKSFRLVKEVIDGKKYSTWAIQEIEIEVS